MDARVHLGAGAPTVRLRWVYTDLPFLPLGTNCIINNRIWNQDQESDLPVGQLPVVESNYEQDARWRLPAGLKADHICNPQWLSTGEPWPTDLPASVVGPPFWIPECCLFLDALAGGWEIGGETGENETPPANMTCPVAFLGTVSVHYPWSNWPLTSQWWTWDIIPGTQYTLQLDGLFFGADLTWFLYQGADCATKTFIFGSFGTVKTVTFTATGAHAFLNLNWQFFGFDYGVLLSLTPFLDPAAGGMELGGSAGDTFRPPDSAEGGMELGGSAGDTFRPPDSAEGGMELGGSAGDTFRGPDPTEGGIELGGSAGDVFTPPGPGPTCATALLGARLTPYTYTINAGANQWYQIPILAFNPVTVQVIGPAPGLQGFYYFGNSCVLPPPWYSGALLTAGNFNTTAAYCYVQVFNPTGSPVTYTIQVN